MNVTIMTGNSKTIISDTIMVEYREPIVHNRLAQQGAHPYGAKANDVRYRIGRRFNKITSIMNLAIGLPMVIAPTISMFRNRSPRQWEPLTEAQNAMLNHRIDYTPPVIDMERRYVY